jgi:hypothetical protein
MLLAVLYSLLVAVGRPCQCLRRPPHLSSHFSSHHNRPPCGAGTTYMQLSAPDSDKYDPEHMAYGSHVDLFGTD